MIDSDTLAERLQLRFWLLLQSVAATPKQIFDKIRKGIPGRSGSRTPAMPTIRLTVPATIKNVFCILLRAFSIK